MQTDEHNIHCCDLLSHCSRKKLGFYRRQLSRIVVYLSKPFWCVGNHYIVVIRFQQPYLPVTHSNPQRYTSLIPLHNPPPPKHLHTPHSIPHFTTLTAHPGSPNFHSTTYSSHLTCGLSGSPETKIDIPYMIYNVCYIIDLHYIHLHMYL